jgi:hypothetical protein
MRLSMQSCRTRSGMQKTNATDSPQIPAFAGMTAFVDYLLSQ